MLSVDWEFLENWKEKWLIIIEQRSIQSKDLIKMENDDEKAILIKKSKKSERFQHNFLSKNSHFN